MMIERSYYQLYVRGIVLTMITLSYSLIVGGITLIVGSSYLQKNPLLIAITIVLLALGFNPIRRIFQNVLIDKLRWFKPINKQLIDEFTRDLTSAKNLATATHIIRQFVFEMFNPSQLHIYLFDPIRNLYFSASNYDKGREVKTSEITFDVNSPLVNVLSTKESPLQLEPTVNLRQRLKQEFTKIALLGATIFIPLQGRSQLMGWIALGDNFNGAPYKQNELNRLMELSNQSALVIERLQISTDLERRINEMNVLTRVSQGVNITLAFDDMLELIYTQINQIININVFHVILNNPEDKQLRYVFYVDEDERITERENNYIQNGYGLDQVVIDGQRPIVTQDYEKECRQHGVIPNIANLYAWAGIPLNTGAETIGLISLGTRKPDIQISTAQINLLQSIADQTAGAMVKVRLLQDADRRTDQLRYLNKISRNLTETLQPTLLLRLVLDGATKLLNCESGGILLFDPSISNLTLRESIGSIYNNLEEALSSEITEIRKNVINDGKGTTFRRENISSEFTETQFVQSNNPELIGLIVPILLKDKPIGIIEVFNRKDGLVFSKDDLELLNALAGQAAIAYDIAEKYTITDQSLAARVEELSVMQQIDRELNTSLDVSLAMDITMKWAVKQSKAESGFVGIIEDDTIRVMSTYGFDKTSSLEIINISEKTPILKVAINSGKPQNRLISDLDNMLTHGVVMESTQAQYVIPIKREDKVIGIISLESSKPRVLTDDTLAFLVRLSDHAAIAISNAQLYLEVQAANLAKSEFVSFVSHELKTPMTSIKGFADLLAAGAVGPISDAQNNFLTTIRSNVDRMATLVSDLTDVSRIEAGRMKLEFEAVSVNDVVKEVVHSSNNQLDSKGQSLIIEIDDSLPAIWCDRTRIIQILTNIVSNAIKYSPINSQIDIKAVQNSDNRYPDEPSPSIHIYVKDNGYGISPQDQRHIFEKFFRADDPNIREVSGTGLGLNITKTLVEMQGGSIWFESILNQGTTFHITIPIADTR